MACSFRVSRRPGGKESFEPNSGPISAKLDAATGDGSGAEMGKSFLFRSSGDEGKTRGRSGDLFCV